MGHYSVRWRRTLPCLPVPMTLASPPRLAGDVEFDPFVSPLCGYRLQVATLFNELQRQDKKLGVISMCIGTGMGAAAVFERE